MKTTMFNAEGRETVMRGTVANRNNIVRMMDNDEWIQEVTVTYKDGSGVKVAR